MPDPQREESHGFSRVEDVKHGRLISKPVRGRLRSRVQLAPMPELRPNRKLTTYAIRAAAKSTDVPPSTSERAVDPGRRMGSARDEPQPDLQIQILILYREKS